MDAIGLPASSNQLSEDNSNKEKEQYVEKDDAIDGSIENSDSSNKGNEQFLEKENAIDEGIENSPCEITIKGSSNISPSAGEEEDAVLGGSDTAKEFDINFDEDELLKDTDTDDCKNSNSESIQIASEITHLESIEGNSLPNEKIEPTPNVPQCSNSGTISEAIHLESIEGNSLPNEEIEPTPNVPQCSNSGKDEDQVTYNVLCNTNVCDTEVARSTLSTNDSSTEDKNPDALSTSDLSTKDTNPNVLCTSDLSKKDTNPNVLCTSDLSTEDKNPNVLSSIDFSTENTNTNVLSTNDLSSEDKNPNEFGSQISNDNQFDLSSDNVEGDKISEVISNSENELIKTPDKANSIETTNTNKTDTFISDNNNENSDNLADQSKSDTSGINNDETKFLHVDEDAPRPDEPYETIDTGGEDPFAQTCDEVMDTSENSEKDPESEKVETLQESTTIDLDEMSSDSTIKTTISEVSKPELSEPITENTTKEIIQVEVAGQSNEDHNKCNRSSPMSQTKDIDVVDSQNNSNFSDTNPPTLQSEEIGVVQSTAVSNNVCNTSAPSSQTEEIISKVHDNDAEILKNTEKGKHNTESNKNVTDLNIFIIADHKKDKISVPETSKVSLISTKPKTYKSNKKARKGSSEEDSNESDFEILTPSVQRPKRNAAKKAESQIKVVRKLEEEAEQQDHDSNAVEEIPGNANEPEEIPDNADEPEEIQTCYTCKKVKNCKINILSYGQTNYFCDDSCFEVFRDGPILKPGESGEIVPSSTVIKEIRSADIQPTERVGCIRKCSQCCSVVKSDNEKTLSWETMDFCSEECLGKYQQELGSHCANCKGNVQPVSLGKYCVRFGYEVKQFCCSTCLEEFKKGLKVCSFCQKDISSGAEGFLAPVGDKGTFKDFCTQSCMEKYEQMSSNQPPPPQTHPCHVCNNIKLVEVEVSFESKVYKLCSDICFTAYKFANKLTVDRCDMCKTYFDKDANGEKFNIFYDEIPHNFCCKTCMNVYILAKRKIVPCNWCKVKKYNFDMIRRVLSTGQVLLMCSLNCMTLYQVSINAVSSRRIKCDMCMSVAQAQYHLTMSDATIRNFCTYPCVMNFQQQYSKSPITLPGSDAPPIPTGVPVPVISSVTSLTNGQPLNSDAKKGSGKLNLVTRLLEPTMCRNKNTQTRPIMHTKSVSCRPHTVSVGVQTEELKKEPALIPVPVPIYVPCPMAMYSFPFPVPVPFPLPVPVPMFLPTTRNSIKGIMKEIKRIQEKVPTDPFQAELLMMAEMVATDKKEEETSSESEPDNEPAAESRPNSDVEGDFNTESIETSNTFGEDIMQIALKMATELDEPTEDLETQLTPATILNQSQSENNEEKPNGVEVPKRTSTGENRGRKRSVTKSPQKRNASSDAKRRKINNNSDIISTPTSHVVIEEAKPDANMKLKYTFGVNAWKSWVNQKNVEIEKLSSTNKKLKPLKTDILQLSVDELNFSLTMFVKEVQKPNGTQYAPDTIYYLCLGIQQYLYENGRIDNIFTDSYFESFTDALDEIAKKFSELFNDHHYIVTRVEEEHLWESKQLGAHSPHVLLSTLMFFNTKHFNLTNVDEHMMLSFSHIMKHWKRNSNQSSTVGGGGGKAPGSRNVLLRFYPPQAVVDDPNSKKKKVYEQQEDEDNPLKCPVKLYEFYMSKCPESVKTRSDVFYLQPERSCVPDSPVWYSTMALNKEPLEKMLNRVKMVKEINIALLTP